jgi:hypothetical protein
MGAAPLRLGLVAGEASGDLLGGLLLAGVRQRGPALQTAGIGGPKMVAQVFSKTAASTERLIKIRSPASQCVLSPLSTWRLSRYRPSLQAKPTCLPLMCTSQATRRAMRPVFWLPVIPTTGIRPLCVLLNRCAMMALPTG